MYDLIADEDIPKPVVEKLRKNFSIFYVEEEQKGSTDEEVIQKSRELETPILTFDGDFFKYSSHPGIMHITQRTSYDLITDAVKDVGKRRPAELCYKNKPEPVQKLTPEITILDDRSRYSKIHRFSVLSQLSKVVAVVV